MLLIPAIDLKDGQCVRLRRGEMDSATVFSKEPANMARHWLEQGARRLHLVDLNGAFAGKPVNEEAVKGILAAVKDFAAEKNTPLLPVQLGGGVRDIATIERYLGYGLSYIIIGTAAVKNPDFVREACQKFPGKIIVGLDAKDGKVATDGWAVVTEHDVTDFAKRFEDFGVSSIVYTDISRDGMMQGINTAATEKLARAISIPVIASGGLHNVADVEALAAVSASGIEGVICGRSIYEGTLDLKSAQIRADELTGA